MTNEEKFRAGTVVYKDDDGDYVCELWEASTHHPDVVYHMNADGKYKKSGLYDDDKYEVFQWLLSIAGDLTFRFHAYSLAGMVSGWRLRGACAPLFCRSEWGDGWPGNVFTHW